ncbi:MAG: M3 family metallopeptidase [Deferribacterales bacterium]
MKTIWSLEGKKEKFLNLVDESKSKIDELVKQKSKNYETFIVPYQEIFAKISEEFTPISHLNSVSNSEETQEIYNETLEKLTIFYTEVGQRKDIYDALSSIPTDGLLDHQNRMIEILKKDFILEGVHLDEDKRGRIREINLNLSKLSTGYFQNILNDTKKFELKVKDRSLLGDMSEEDIKTYYKDGEYVFNLTAPSYSAFMKYCEDEKLREEMFRAYYSRGAQNGGIIEEILALRKEKANILGFRDYVELSLFTKTAGSYEEVNSFLHSLLDSAKDFIKDDYKNLEDTSKKLGLGALKGHNIQYLIEKLRRKELDLKEDEVRRYFEQTKTIDGLIDFVSNFFQIDFKNINEDVWHECVKVYEILENGERIGELYFDLEARFGKRDGAWMNEWFTRYRKSNGELVLPKVFIVGNFPPSREDNRSLLRHTDVETVFHEMGHALHHLLSKSDDYFISGINGVEWDVVEFPSQFLENFAFEMDILKKLGRDIYTGDEIPDDLILKIQKERGFFAGYQLGRQIEFSLFDLYIHKDAYKEYEVDLILKSVRKEVGSLELPDYVKFQNQFSHIFSGGYAAGYYSYKWAEVLSADLFVEYKENKDIELIKDGAKKLFTLGGKVNIYDEYIKIFRKKPEPGTILKIYRLV